MRRALVIDDEATARDAVALMLRSEGWHVVVAEGGYAGIDAIAAFAFDLVIVDIFMPGLNGVETIKILRQDAPDLPVIVMSGHVAGPEGFDVLAGARQAGATRFLPKPILRQELLAAAAACSMPAELVA